MNENKFSIRPGPPSPGQRVLDRSGACNYPLLSVDRVVSPDAGKDHAQRNTFFLAYAWDRLIPHPSPASDQIRLNPTKSE